MKAGQFYRDTVEARFLFESDVVAYFDEVYTKGRQLAQAHLDLERTNLSPEFVDELNRQIETLEGWFYDQSDDMFGVFMRDLSIKTL